MSIRAEREEEYDTYIETFSGSWFVDDKARAVDRWVSYDISHGARSVHMGRYQNPEIRAAIRNLRAAARVLENLLSREFRQRAKNRNKK